MISGLLLAALPLLAVYLYTRLRYLRFRQYANIPQIKSSLVWGHMRVLNDFILRGKVDRHIDQVLSEMSDELGNPPILLLDLRPASYPMAVVTSHEVAEQVSRTSKLMPWSTPKSPTMLAFQYLLGKQSIMTQQGEEWKHLRRMFNPGFAPKHLHSLLPCIVEKTRPFLRHLDAYARSGDEFCLDTLTIPLTFDIIGAVVMDADFDAQHLDKARQGEFIRLYRALADTYSNDKTQFPSWFFPGREWRRYRLGTRIETLLKALVREKYDEMRQHMQQQKNSGEKQKKSRSVLGLSLQDVDPADLTDALVSDVCDQIKSFLFAGHDTTSILLAWILYELSRTPHALAAVRAELDAVFGPDSSPASVGEKLTSPEGEDLIQRLSYCSATIKEALRLHPPAGTARMTPPGTGFAVKLPEESGGGELCLDGLVIYNCATLIQRDDKVYGETKEDFVPERWLGNTDTSEDGQSQGDEKEGGKAGKIPNSAWRPFERGPRNCIGQELANIEARVILAMVARRYDFVKVGLGALELNEHGEKVLNEKGQWKVKEELYNTRQVTAKPVDGTRMKVRLASSASAELR
ncbi:cytochrome P450 [Bombardia bombarda]|uniref:Cytochrome P450 n=1 Tax=Bombardia bombarda TaxID=252184 RepID=A0AA39W9L4_9PEZI|nr:cytochrome P450 [Bombardia bombarda]